jgi:hypothetical protein
VSGGAAAHTIEPDGADPFDMFAEWDSGQLLMLALLLSAAIGVFWYGSRAFAKQRSASSLRPRGRPFFDASGRASGRDAVWRERVAAIERRAPTAIAEAVGGLVRIEGTIVNASGNLGGRRGRECVWRNRAGANPDSAVAAELIVVADATGQAGVENLERARIIAPAEPHGLHWENVSLYLGDRIEVIGTFEADRVGDEADPTQLVYGTLGGRDPLQVRLVHREAPPAADDTGTDGIPPEPSDASHEDDDR